MSSERTPIHTIKIFHEDPERKIRASAMRRMVGKDVPLRSGNKGTCVSVRRVPGGVETVIRVEVIHPYVDTEPDENGNYPESMMTMPDVLLD